MGTFKCDCENCKYPDCRCQNGYVLKDGYFRPCDVFKEWQKSEVYSVQCEKAGLGNDRKPLDFSDYRGEDDNIPILEELSKDYSRFLGENLYVYGDNSTQKTTMLKAYGRHIIWNNRDYDFMCWPALIRFISMSDVQRLLRELDQLDCEDRENKEYFLNTYKECKILILDESFDSTKMQASRNDDYHVQLMDKFIRERLCKADKTTIFISNVRPEKIDDKFGKSFKELIIRSCGLLEFNFKIEKSENKMPKFTIRGTGK